MTKRLEFQECVDGIRYEIEKRLAVNYGDPAAVRKFNRAYRKCFSYVQYIDDHYPEKINVLIDMFEDGGTDFVLHCAPMIIRLNNSTHEQKEKAIQVIKRVITSGDIDTVTKMGFEKSLRDWERDV